MNDSISGYLIVDAVRESGGYVGVDRNPWEAIDAAYWNDELSPSIRAPYEAIRADPRNDFWWPICVDLPHAREFQAVSSSLGCPSDVIAVLSPYLRDCGQAVPRPVGCEMLGFDVVGVGEWSLLRILTETGQAEGAALNAHGLLATPDLSSSVEGIYRQLAASGLVEPLADPDPNIPVEAVAVYSVSRAGV